MKIVDDVISFFAVIMLGARALIFPLPVSSATPLPLPVPIVFSTPTFLPTIYPTQTATPTAIPTPTFTPVYTPVAIQPIVVDPSGKRIYVDLAAQRLSYLDGPTLVGTMLISSGLSITPTPKGTFAIMAKIPSIRYRGYNRDGSIYDYPNTKWNLRFKPSYYLHGAYWHNNFGHPMSHGCINIAYRDVEALYDWADVGTPVIIY